MRYFALFRLLYHMNFIHLLERQTKMARLDPATQVVIRYLCREKQCVVFNSFIYIDKDCQLKFTNPEIIVPVAPYKAQPIQLFLSFICQVARLPLHF